jgi:hypothetical protein
MPFVDPSIRFWISFAVFVAVGVTNGTVHLTNAIPELWIPIAISWCGIIAFVGGGFVALLNGMAMTTQSRLASAAAVPEVKSIVTTQAIAETTPSDKIVGPPKATGTKA